MKEYIVRCENEYLQLLPDKMQELVRCVDCKHRPVKLNCYDTGFDLGFPDDKCPCKCEDVVYSWYPADDWFCADGERK